MIFLFLNKYSTGKSLGKDLPIGILILTALAFKMSRKFPLALKMLSL